MESETTQEEDPTSNTMHQNIAISKESLELTNEHFSKLDRTESENDKLSEMLLDPSECDSQKGKVNGKVSDKEEEEESVEPEQLSQSSTSDDSSASSDVSSSSSDDETNSSNQNRWSSSVTCKGIKLSVRSIRDASQPDDASRDSENAMKSIETAFCKEVKSSRLSDDSSSSDSVETSPSRSHYLKSNNSNCNDSNSLENDFVGENLSPNSRHNSTNFKNSISNFTSPHLGAFSIENSTSVKSSCNSRNDRRSIDSVGSHLSMKSNNDIVFERKLSLSSDSSDSEISCDRLENTSGENTVDPNNETNLICNVKRDSNNLNINRIKPNLNNEGCNEFLNSTCVKFNDVNTVRSPENKPTSPVKENSQGSSSVDGVIDNSAKTQKESIPKPVSPEQKLNCITTFKLSDAGQSENDSTIEISSNSISKRTDNSVAENASEDLAVHTNFTKKNCVVKDLAKGDASHLGAENSFNNESFSSSSISISSESSEVDKDFLKGHGIVSDPVSAANVKREQTLGVAERVTDSNGPTDNFDLDFKSQDMGMEISSDSSLSSDEVSDEDSISRSHNLSDFNLESGTSEKETDEPIIDVRAVIGCNNERKSEETRIDVMKVIGGDDEGPSKETMADIMKIIGVSSGKESPEPMDVDNVKGIKSGDKESEETQVDVMKVIHDKKEKPSKEEMADVMKIIGVSNSEETAELMDVDVLKVIGCGSFESREPDQILSVSSKSQTDGIVTSQGSTSGIGLSSSKTSCEPSKKVCEHKLTEDKEDSNKTSTDFSHISSANKVSPCGPSKNCDSQVSHEETSMLPKLDTKPYSRLYELLHHDNKERKSEPKKVSSSDSILSILNKDINSSTGTNKHMLSNEKKDCAKLNNKSIILNSGTSNEFGQVTVQAPTQKCEKNEEPQEYAQFVGLQPTLKFRCCICAQIGFQSYAELREHQKNCQSAEAGKSSTSFEKSVSYPNADDINQTNFRITRKVYLCSACGTYYENWNLFLHMQEVHQRYICLLCLGMFTMSYKLSDHLILTHGVEVKSFQNLLDFKQAFNCELYVSCTDCGKTFGESDNWSSHHCMFTCNVCNIKNGHLPRCPRNFIFKGDETVADVKLHTKCIIRINPNSCSTTTILPKRDDKPYDIASSFCSVDLAEEGESVSGSEKNESPRLIEKSSGEEEMEKINGRSTQTKSNKSDDDSLLEEDESSNHSDTLSYNVDQSLNKCLDQPQSEEKRLEATNDPTTGDESCNEIGSKSEISNSNSGVAAGNQGDALCKSNAEEIESRMKTSDLTSENESDSQDEKFDEISSVESYEAQKSQKSEKRSDMKLIIKKSVLKVNTLKVDKDSEQSEKALADLGTLSQKEVDDSKQNKMDSSVFDPDYEVQKSTLSRSLTSPINYEDENQISEPIGSNPNTVPKDNLDFKNLLNPNPRTQDSSSLGFKSEAQIARKESEKEESNFDASMESQPSVSNDSGMEYESDSQPDPTDKNDKISKKAEVVNSEENPSSLPSNDTSDSDSNKLSMAVDNTDVTMDSRSSLKSNPTDEKMMIDYDGDNAVDNADAVGQSETNYNNFDSDQDSTLSDDIALASEDVPALTLPLTGSLESISLNTIVKECVRISCTACAYCNHALKIAVHARELILHLLAEHRFTPSQTEDSPGKLISLLKNGITSLENVFFNTNSYDSSDKASNLPYDGTFSCFQCPFWTLQHKDLYTHKRKMHQKTILLCVMCKSNFYSYSELLCHMCPGTYQPNDILFRCCFCHIDKIPSAFRLMVHIRKIHHTCEICLDVSTDQQKLATHMWKHKLHHLCYRCGIAYRNKPDITRHLFWKHGTESVLCKKCLQKKWPHVYHFCIPPTTVVCDECSATFTRTVALRVHKRLHSNEKPYACTQCEEKFISKKILEKHEIAHTIKEEDKSQADAAKKENYDPSVPTNLLGLTDPPIQIQKTDEKQNIDVDDETVPVIRIKKNKTKKRKPMLDLTDLPPLNLSSESDSEPEATKPVVTSETTEVKSEVDGNSETATSDTKENLPVETEEKKENIVEITDSQRLEIILADHDYCKPQSEEKEYSAEGVENKDNKPETNNDLNNSLNSTLDTKETSASDSSPTKQKSKSPKKKLNKSSNSSSSSSSSDTDSSSCSCGSNCSCSSSSSDSTTSTSSDSDSSNPENRRKQEERRQKRRERAKTKSPKIESQPEPIISVENEEPIIMESDLDTDITLTDEDFYDEYPQQHANKMLAEKQQSEKDQLMLLASVAPTHTAPSSPIVSAEETPAPQSSEPPKLKKKLKTKRKRDETLDSASMQYHAQSPSESKFSQLPSNPSLITKLPNPNARSYASMSQTPTSEHFSDRTLSTGGSGSESESKRSSKRRRTKNRFYGYSSEEENQTESIKPRFKPKKFKKIVAVRKSEPTLMRPQSFSISSPVQPPTMSTHQSYQPHQPSITIKPVVPPVSEVIRSTLPPFRHRPPSPSSSSDSDDDKLNIDEKFSEPPQLTPTPALAPPQQTVEKNTNLYCYCQCPYDEVSEMIACDGDDCRIEWFHFECVGIMVPPKGQWFCPDCRKKKNLSY